MIKLGFWFDFIEGYTGGLNYIRNLLHAIAFNKQEGVELIVFIGKDAKPQTVEQFSPYATIVRTRILDRKSPSWLIHKILYRKFGSLWMVNRLLKNQNISVLFAHLGNLSGRGISMPLINWIPDFQYLHLPDLFPGLIIDKKTAEVISDVEKCNLVLLSSYAALDDFRSIAPECAIAKTRVLQFVSQPGSMDEIEPSGPNIDQIAYKYHFKGKFFYLPNQFWSHKNHLTVFKAVKLLKNRGKEILVICTGNPHDYRLSGAGHFERLQQYIVDNELQANIMLLGLIDYQEVLSLNRNSIAVLNPSRFEGWSSSVEEAKSIGKSVILSDIKVHREQAPLNGTYFQPDDAFGLARILEGAWDHSEGGPDLVLEAIGRENLEERTLAYGRGYLAIVDELLASAPSYCAGRPPCGE